MKIYYQILMGVLLTLLTWSIHAQDTSIIHHSYRLDLGLGSGSASGGGGLGGRVALAYSKGNWGAIIRFTACDGESETKSSFLGPSIKYTESIYDRAILLSHIKQNKQFQLLASGGIGFVHGKLLDESRSALVNMNPDVGVAFELGLATKTMVGLSITLMGNLNTTASMFGVIFSITLGSYE